LAIDPVADSTVLAATPEWHVLSIVCTCIIVFAKKRGLMGDVNVKVVAARVDIIVLIRLVVDPFPPSPLFTPLTTNDS
jgi:hypothetical protein